MNYKYSKNTKLKEKRKRRHLNLITLKNKRIKECLERIDDNTLEGQIYKNLSNLEKKNLYLKNNPYCLNKNNIKFINKKSIDITNIFNEKKLPNNLNYINSPLKPINLLNNKFYNLNNINSPLKPVNTLNNNFEILNKKILPEKNIKNQDNLEIVNNYKKTYKEILIKNIKYKKLNKNLEKEIRRQVLINKLKDYYKNKTYFFIKENKIIEDKKEDISYCIIS